MNSPVEALAKAEATYSPGTEISEALSRITIVPIIGPVAVGKSACMERAVDDKEFGRVQSFTTRPQREGEAPTEYRFRPHDDATIVDIADAAQLGALVQYAVHPTTGHIYGSDLTDYHRPFMMLDTLSSNVAALRQLPFGDVREITLVTTPIEWARRFAERSAPVDERLKRIREGISSLTWSLEQGDQMMWVSNPCGPAALSSAAQELRGLVKGDIEPDVQNRKVGERLLATLQSLI